jgi:hypothetical protein
MLKEGERGIGGNGVVDVLLLLRFTDCWFCGPFLVSDFGLT